MSIISRTLALLAAAAVLTGWAAGSIWSSSADLAHHYALVARLAEHWSLPPGFDLSLMEMNHYPRASHKMAALAGSAFDSPLIGLQVVTLLSIVALWTALVYCLLSLPRSAALAASVVLAVVLIANKFVRLELHGSEVVDNYFFSQLAGQAVMLVAISLALPWDRSGRRGWTRYVLLLAAMVLTLDVHLLPAVELMGVVLVLVVLDGLAQGGMSRSALTRTAGIALAVGLVAGAIVVFHPTFTMMRAITHEGHVGLRFESRLPVLALLCAIVGCLGAGAGIKWLKLAEGERRQLLVLKYFAAYAISVAALCAVQFGAYFAGQGSAYAIKKYAFGLNTALMLAFVLVVALAWHSRRSSSRDPIPFRKPWWLAPLLVTIAFVSIVPAKRTLDTSAIVRVERQVQAMRDTVLPRLPGKNDYAIGLAGMGPTVNYLISIGTLKAPRDEIAYAILFNRQIDQLSGIGTIVTSENQRPYDIAACRRFLSATSLVLLEGECVARHLHAGTLCRGTLDLTRKGWIHANAIRGFSHPEDHGRWSDGGMAAFSCTLPQEGPLPTVARIDAAALLHGTPEQRVLVAVNDSAPVEYRFARGAERRIIEVPLPQQPGAEARIRFAFPDARSPQARGMNNDTRSIAISVRSIEFR